ncbi:unnamed protein product [Effrenium voratum]|nr:unnamed protein product [Effrenium voratum]
MALAAEEPQDLPNLAGQAQLWENAAERVGRAGKAGKAGKGPQASPGPDMAKVMGFDPMQDAIDSLISDLMPFKEKLEKANATAEAKEAKRRREQLKREAHCWKECKGCHFKEAQAVEECFATLEAAKVACASELPRCHGISTQSNVCNGTWALQVGSTETVEVPEELEPLRMQTFALDAVCLSNVRNANASKYVISLQNRSWVDAEKACAEKGLQLATPRNKEDMKALNAAMETKGVQKVHIGLRRDVQFGKGAWTDPSAFYWVDGAKLDADWPGWGGYGFSGTDGLDVPVKQPHWEAFLDGCCYVGYYQTQDEDGTKGVGDTTCNFYLIPYACQPVEEQQVRETVTTTTSTASAWHYGLAMTGQGACPDGLGVTAVPLEQCQEAAMNAVLPQGAKRGRTALQAGYDVGSKDALQPWLGAPAGCSLHSGGDWAPVFNMGKGVNNGEYTPICMQPMPNASYLAEGIEVVETAFPYDSSGKYFYFPAQEWEEKTGRDLSPLGTTQSITQYRNNFPVWAGIVRVWRNMLGVHGRREFSPMPAQWQRGDLVMVGVMCPSGFSLIPYDLGGPDEMQFETSSLAGCAEKCQETVRCSSFEFSHSESRCSTFTAGLENFKSFSGRPNVWISCAREELLGSPGSDPALESTTTATTDPLAWKKAIGACAFADGGEVNTGGFSIGNMSSKECHEACRTQQRCTAYQMEEFPSGTCVIHTSVYVKQGSGAGSAHCFIKPPMLSCSPYNSEDCAEAYAVADFHKSTAGFCEKCSADGVMLRDRCQLCCEKCSESHKPPAFQGENVAFSKTRGPECEANTFDLDGDVANGCEVGCPKLPGANCLACTSPTNCSSLSCLDNFYDADGNASNGCEIRCPDVNNAVCRTCEDSICTRFDCTSGFFDGDFNVRNGCEAPCPMVPNARCQLCQGPWVCKDYKCEPNYFEVDGNYTNGCEASCPSRPHGSCKECNNPFKCAVALTCDKDYYDADGIEANGCEVSCPSVSRGTCTACSGKPLECFDFVCEGSWFDVDGKIENGCEVTCPAVDHGNCTSCSHPEKCTSVSCEVNRFDADGDASNGCETACPKVTGAECTNCSSPTNCFMLSACEDNFFNDDADARNGCEVGCPAVPGGNCTACLSSAQCAAVQCEAHYFDLDGDASNGCEVGPPQPPAPPSSSSDPLEQAKGAICPPVPHGECTRCSDSRRCDAYKCEANYFDVDRDLANGCERSCPQVPGARCTACQSPDSCSEFTCHAHTLDVDGLVENGCEVSCDVCNFANKTRNACQRKQEAPSCLLRDTHQRSCECFEDSESCESGSISKVVNGTVAALSCEWKVGNCLEGLQQCY